MKNYKSTVKKMDSVTSVTIDKLVSITCDKCHKTYDESHQWDEIQEFHHIEFTAGYGANRFHDGYKIKADICQYCFYEMIIGFCTIEESDCLF